jgi:hypothetical protein
MFHRIRVDVIAKTNGDQVPWTEDGIQRPERPVFAPDVPATAAVPTARPTSDAAQAWAAAQGTTSQDVLEAFIRRYGDSFYGDLARARLEELKKMHADTPAQVLAPASPNEPGSLTVLQAGPTGALAPTTPTATGNGNRTACPPGYHWEELKYGGATFPTCSRVR